MPKSKKSRSPIPTLEDTGKTMENRQAVDSSTLKKDSFDERLIWIDLEMTGLDLESDKIIEIACLVTDGDLNVVAEGPDLVIHQSDDLLKNMGEWCTEHHEKSGLTEAVRCSKIDTLEAERVVLNFVQQHTHKGKCPLAGNSVGMDRRFLDKYMPLLASHLHYRIVDVTTVKELCKRWYSEKEQAPPKNLHHRARSDILESLEELRFYKATIFK